MKKIIVRILMYVFGSFSLGLGITFALTSGVGSGAFDAMNYSISSLFDISVGDAMYLSLFTLFLASMLLKPDKKYIAGFIMSLMTGVFVNFWLSVLSMQDVALYQVTYFALSLFFAPLGITFMIRSEMPLSPMDTLMLILVEKLNASISFMKTSIEVVYVFIALLFGFVAGIGTGTISIGTIIITLSIGPLMEIFLKYIKEYK